MSLLPSKPDLVSDAGPRVVGVDSEDADDLMSALSSAMARRLLAELHDDPAPPAELSERVDTTLQNTQYHLSNLEEAGAVEVIGTAYSEKGREMDVYAPADQPLVIYAGQEQQASGLKAALSRLLGGVGALLVGSLAIQQVFGDGIARKIGFGATGGASDSGGAGGAGGADSADGDAPTESTATERATDAQGGSGGDAGGADSATPTPEADRATPTPEPEPTATATSDEPGIFTGGESTETATRTAADTVAATEEAATSTPIAESTSTPTAAATSTPTSTPVPTETVQAASDGGVDLVASLPPGALFFLGGLTVLLVGIAVTYGK